ncbi:GTPase, G3E family [Clostridium cavendishii DSM 21758]|uniref:GTPase, G3E family n=1 Tax=Clostridium cavendishii DSM 21758 TaxID=1121302 RepID=A0A1M6SVQ7_9CLOT|nr:GTP-binding protein [Clostridium cavendishii]SHK48794.1 GTPase, G3E family [Clostridium cavendishii DSM 21758]
MKIDIISGFLGAGKTTLIKKLIKEELNKEKIAIIENEYGEVGIDGNLLKNEKIDVKEITSGCICCTITGDFKAAIIDIIKEYRPERIIIEPSGVAKLSQVIAAIVNNSELKGARINMKIAVVDIQNLDMYLKNFGEFYINQIVSANTIVLSRTQYSNIKELTHASMAIRKLNPNCSIITTPWEEIESKRIIEVAEHKLKDVFKEVNLIKMPLNTPAIRGQIRTKNGSADDVFENWGTETPRIFSLKELKQALNALNDKSIYGEVLRAKGIVRIEGNRWVQFDYVPNDIQIVDFSSDYTGRICVIGSKINKEPISKLFLKES